MAEDKTKVWLFYKDNELCGFTCYKYLKRPQCKMKTKNMSKKEFDRLNRLHYDCMLFQNVMDDGNIVIQPVTTYKENDELEHMLNMFEHELEALTHELDHYPIKSKIKKKLVNALQYVDSEGDYKFNIIRIYLRFIANYDI